jgi:hypothetical protein
MFQRLAAALLFALLVGISGQAAQAATPLTPTTAGPSIVAAQPTVLAQEDSSGGSTRVRTRGIGKLIVLVIAGVVGVGGWIIRKIKGE